MDPFPEVYGLDDSCQVSHSKAAVHSTGCMTTPILKASFVACVGVSDCLLDDYRLGVATKYSWLHIVMIWAHIQHSLWDVYIYTTIPRVHKRCVLDNTGSQHLSIAHYIYMAQNCMIPTMTQIL